MNSKVRGCRNYFLIDNAPAIQVQLKEIDIAIDAIAGQRFNEQHDMYTAWQMRERFLPDVQSKVRQSQINAEVSVLTGAYPIDQEVNSLSIPSRTLAGGHAP